MHSELHSIVKIMSQTLKQIEVKNQAKLSVKITDYGSPESC
jgi:hypothetical protein